MFSRIDRTKVTSIFFVFFIFGHIEMCLSDHVFLIGDSIDRYMVTYWCDDMERTHGKVVERIEFGEGSLKYASARSNLPCILCKVDNFTSLGFVHIFGGSDEGPYYTIVNTNLPADDYYYSRDRVAKAFSLYFNHVPWPDRVFVQTTMWDCSYYIVKIFGENANLEPTSPLFIAALEEFRNNTNFRIDQVEKILRAQKAKLLLTDAHVSIGTRTTPWMSLRGNILHGLNDVIRAVAAQRGLSLYDYDRDAWFSTFSIATGAGVNSSRDVPSYDVRFESSILNDDHIHPLQSIALSAAKKVMASKYSKFAQFTGPMAKTWYARFLDPLSANVSKALFIRGKNASHGDSLSSSSNPIFCLHVHPTGERHVAHHSFLQLTHFAQGDVLDVDVSILDKYRIGRPLPSAASSTHASWGIVVSTYPSGEVHYFNTVSGARFYASSYSFAVAEHQYNSSLVEKLYDKNIAVEVNPDEGTFWIDELLPIFGDCPSFPNRAMLQIKGQKAIYVILDGVRRSLPCWNYVYFMGLDGEGIIKYIIQGAEDFEKLDACVPEGPSLDPTGVC